jgi:nucleoside-diphosphate-sugar epimerase
VRIAVTGATGFIGHHTVAHLLACGYTVTALGRRPSRHGGAAFAPFDLDGPEPDLSGHDVLIHAALSHVPGRFRGGEGDAPADFLSRNLDGTLRLFAAARAQGVRRILFLSTRAVYGDYPPGTPLPEDLPARPDTLYGEVKLRAEQALAELAGPGLQVASLRVTGVWGPPVPGLPHKWASLFDDFARRRPIPPRVATEVYADDVAAALRLLALASPADLFPGVFNLSDIVLDRHDLLSRYAALAGLDAPLPARADAGGISVMPTDRIRTLGWQPSGLSRLDATLAAMLPAR